MRSPVPEIKHHPKNQPHNQPQPSAPRKAQHQQQRDSHPQDGHHRNERRFEGTRQIRPPHRKIQTPPETITKASSVPMEVSWLNTLIGSTLANSATARPTIIEEIHAVRNLG